LIDVKIIPLPLFFGNFYMDEPMIKLGRKITEQPEKFLITCKLGDGVHSDEIKGIERIDPFNIARSEATKQTRIDKMPNFI